jgi:hypothetical protein
VPAPPDPPEPADPPDPVVVVDAPVEPEEPALVDDVLDDDVPPLPVADEPVAVVDVGLEGSSLLHDGA